MDDDTGRNLAELVELLREIDEKADSEETEDHAFVVYDKKGNKIYL